jgi:hypothetical protein
MLSDKLITQIIEVVEAGEDVDIPDSKLKEMFERPTREGHSFLNREDVKVLKTQKIIEMARKCWRGLRVGDIVVCKRTLVKSRRVLYLRAEIVYVSNDFITLTDNQIKYTIQFMDVANKEMVIQKVGVKESYFDMHKDKNLGVFTKKNI